MKCDFCKKKVEELFLGKIKGTFFMKGKIKKAVCADCQKGSSLEDLKKKVGL
tara:strand:+ start:100719 stop:100874 length:156 start_codon:yes stop_codon:yes gene_type:complete